MSPGIKSYKCTITSAVCGPPVFCCWQIRVMFLSCLFYHSLASCAGVALFFFRRSWCLWLWTQRECCCSDGLTGGRYRFLCLLLRKLAWLTKPAQYGTGTRAPVIRSRNSNSAFSSHVVAVGARIAVHTVVVPRGLVRVVLLDKLDLLCCSSPVDSDGASQPPPAQWRRTNDGQLMLSGSYDVHQ